MPPLAASLREHNVSAFIELVILPAVLPWLVVLLAGRIEARLDSLQPWMKQRCIDDSIIDGNSA